MSTRKTAIIFFLLFSKSSHLSPRYSFFGCSQWYLGYGVGISVKQSSTALYDFTINNVSQEDLWVPGILSLFSYWFPSYLYCLNNHTEWSHWSWWKSTSPDVRHSTGFQAKCRFSRSNSWSNWRFLCPVHTTIPLVCANTLIATTSANCVAARASLALSPMSTQTSSFSRTRRQLTTKRSSMYHLTLIYCQRWSGMFLVVHILFVQSLCIQTAGIGKFWIPRQIRRQKPLVGITLRMCTTLRAGIDVMIAPLLELHLKLYYQQIGCLHYTCQVLGSV